MKIDTCSSSPTAPESSWESDDIVDYDVAEQLSGIPKGTLYQLVSQRRIPHLRFGPRFVRFSKKALTNWLASHFVPVVSVEETNALLSKSLAAPRPSRRRK